jgi:hypothetical protein
MRNFSGVIDPVKNDFSGVIDPVNTISAGSLTTLKHDPAEIVVLGPQLLFKGIIPQNYFIGKYPHTIS